MKQMVIIRMPHHVQQSKETENSFCELDVSEWLECQCVDLGLESPKEFHPAIPQGSVFIHPFTEHSLDLGETELFYPTRRISHHSIVRTFSKEQITLCFTRLCNNGI
jgi:hypothetical protein